MENNNPPIQCPVCQSAIKHISAGISKKNDKPYDEFWACISSECRFTWSPSSKPAPKTAPISPQQVADGINKDVKTINALKIVRENLDSVIKYLEK